MKIKVMNILAGILGGFLLAMLVEYLVLPAWEVAVDVIDVENIENVGHSPHPVYFYVSWMAGFVLAFFAETALKAWRRIFICASLCSFLSLVVTIVGILILLARGTEEINTEYSIWDLMEILLGGGVVSIFYILIVFFVGIVFLILGLVVGKNKKKRIKT